MQEPWATLLFVGGGSLLLQIGKVVSRKFGDEISKTVVHWGAIVLTAAFLGLTGGFAGIPVPAVPSGADAMAWLGFISSVGGMVVAGAAAIAGVYDLALKRIFGGLRLG